ncbi:hypothetical protein [Spirosoma sp. KUDC1026]|uniref:hypothetical protein n=1 Tax=Spirosoma sp. KUDC1026 TaxID=2745947 RepID=UPI00159BD66C|nr:hypothetical protein [Spirosoma sp. KUDC1026]QKZ14816.1 hypothetical protein HU175_20180 [Spirosoma sp. KUDC1026]
MKQYLFLATASLFTLVSGCKKSDPVPETDLTVGLTGVYPLTSLQSGSVVQTLPDGAYSMKFTTSRLDNTHLSAVLTVTETPGSFDLGTYTFGLTPNPNADSLVNVSVQGTSVGTMSTKTMDVAVQWGGNTRRVKAAR